MRWIGDKWDNGNVTKGNKKKNLEYMKSIEMIEFLKYKIIENKQNNKKHNKKNSIFRPHGLLSISEQKLNSINNIRKERNDVFHGDRRATKGGASSVSRHATKAMWNIMRIGGVEYNKRLKEWNKAPAVSFRP